MGGGGGVQNPEQAFRKDGDAWEVRVGVTYLANRDVRYALIQIRPLFNRPPCYNDLSSRASLTRRWTSNSLA